MSSTSEPQRAKSPMSSTRKIALVTGIFYMITFILI